MVSAVRAEHHSVGHLLESRCAAATSEVFEALRERACRSIENVDVIEREGLAGFSAPFDSFLRRAVHDRARKLGTGEAGPVIANLRAWRQLRIGRDATKKQGPLEVIVRGSMSRPCTC